MTVNSPVIPHPQSGCGMTLAYAIKDGGDTFKQIKNNTGNISGTFITAVGNCAADIGVPVPVAGYFNNTENLIRLLNPKIGGWANYHSHICAKQTFSKANHIVFKILWRWCKRRHSNKGTGWIRRKYFRSEGNRHWIFSATTKDKQGKKSYLALVEATQTPIKRHVKIKADANPYDPVYTNYFDERLARRKESTKRKNRVNGKIWFPWWATE